MDLSTLNGIQRWYNMFFICLFFSQQVEELQDLVKSATLKRELITSPIPVPAPSTSLQYHQTGSLWTQKHHIKSLPFSSQVYGWVELWSLFLFDSDSVKVKNVYLKWLRSISNAHMRSRLHLFAIHVFHSLTIPVQFFFLPFSKLNLPQSPLVPEILKPVCTPNRILSPSSAK